MKLETYDRRSTEFISLTPTQQREFVLKLRQRRLDLVKEKPHGTKQKTPRSPSPMSMNRKDPERKALLAMLKKNL